MAWLKIDDTVPEHRKMLEAGPDACWLWVCGIAYAQRQLSDGYIPKAALPVLGIVAAQSKLVRLAEVLVRVGLFEHADGGYQVHDYHDHNATSDEARERRAALSDRRSSAGRAGGIQSGIARRSNEPNVKQTVEANAKQTPSNTSKQNEAPTRPDPYKNPPTPHADARGAVRLTRANRKRAEEILRIRFGRCQHDPPCVNHEACVVAVVDELAVPA